MPKYLTIGSPACAEINIMRSVFIASAYPLEYEDQFKEYLNEIRIKYHQATHHCYAYKFGFNPNEKKFFSDHGEPSGTAGKPILGVILKYSLTNIGIFVSRYFGGKKLGVRGLIEAYSEVAELAITNATIIERASQTSITITCDYASYQKILYLLHSNKAVILSQTFEQPIQLVISIYDEDTTTIIKKLHELDCSYKINEV